MFELFFDHARMSEGFHFCSDWNQNSHHNSCWSLNWQIVEGLSVYGENSEQFQTSHNKSSSLGSF